MMKSRRFQIAILLLLIANSLYSQVDYPFFDGSDKWTFCLMEKAERQIEEYRQGDFTLQFTDDAGETVIANAVIELKAHSFDFGTDLFGLHSISNSDPGKVTALKAIDTLFNTLIVCDYWGINQKELNGAFNWGSPDYGFSLAESMDKKPRYHALIYGFPYWLHNYPTEEELWDVIEQRIKNVAERYGDKVVEVDVINEFINYQYWDGNSHANYLKTTKFPDFAKPENGLRVLQMAKEHLPNAKLVVLETGLWSVSNPIFQEIYQYHKSLIELGAPEYYIAYQAHYYAQGGMPFQEGTPNFGPRTFMMDEISKGIEQMGTLGRPMLISEFNPPSRNKNSTNPDQPGLTDEEIAAWETNFYTLMFSKPFMKGLSRWFTIDNLGGKGMDAGVVTEDGELKPNYFALRKLINEKWHTKWEGQLGESVDLKAYYGKYLVKVEGYEDMYIDLVPSSQQQTLVLKKSK